MDYNEILDKAAERLLESMGSLFVQYGLNYPKWDKLDERTKDIWRVRAKYVISLIDGRKDE